MNLFKMCIGIILKRHYALSPNLEQKKAESYNYSTKLDNVRSCKNELRKNWNYFNSSSKGN